MNAAARGGGASIRSTLSTTWLSGSLASEARRLDAHIHGKIGSTLSPLTKKHIPRRPCCSLELNRRSGATVPSRENSFAQVPSPKRTTKRWVTGTMRLSIDSLQHLQDYFSSPRASFLFLPSFASQRRLLGLRRRSFRTPGCRSGVDLDDLGAKKVYEEMLAKKVKA